MGPVLGPGAAFNNLFCEPAGFFIDPQAACRWQYPSASNVVARVENPDDAASWKCFGTVTTWSTAPVVSRAGDGAPVPDGPLGALVVWFTGGKYSTPIGQPMVYREAFEARQGDVYLTTVYFRLNEPAAALGDNRGSLTLTITIG